MNYLKAYTSGTLILLFLSFNSPVFPQTQITGKVVDTNDNSPLAYVNIGIKEKNRGTLSKEDGSFSMDIPSEYQSDSLTFSIVGYYESNLSIRDLIANKNVVIPLKQKPTQLEEVVVTGAKPVEKSMASRNAVLFILRTE